MHEELGAGAQARAGGGGAGGRPGTFSSDGSCSVSEHASGWRLSTKCATVVQVRGGMSAWQKEGRGGSVEGRPRISGH